MAPHVSIKDDRATVKAQYSDTGHILNVQDEEFGRKCLLHRNVERTHRKGKLLKNKISKNVFDKAVFLIGTRP